MKEKPQNLGWVGLQAVLEQVQNLINEGNIEEANNLLTKTIEQAKDNRMRQVLYTKKSELKKMT